MEINKLSFLAKFPHPEELSKCIKNFKNLISQDCNISLHKYLKILVDDDNKTNVYLFRNIHINRFYVDGYIYKMFIASTDKSLLKMPNTIELYGCYLYFCNDAKLISNTELKIIKRYI